MKTRIGFVSNSSSSSFILAGDKQALQKPIKINIEVDLSDYLDSDCDLTDMTKEQIDEYFLNDYGDDYKKLSFYKKTIAAIKAGKSIMRVSFSDDDSDNPLESYLRNDFGKDMLEGTGIEIIHGDD